MIVKCGSCQTRFKIPDEKVTDKGVKVRCTKCQNTFRVTKADAQPPAPSGPPPRADADPFAKFGPTSDPVHAQQTRPVQMGELPKEAIPPARAPAAAAPA